MGKTHREKWFENCGGWSPRHSLKELRAGIAKGLLNEQDETGMSALSLAAASGWIAGVNELIRAGADMELRHYRTGATALHVAVEEENESIITALIKGGANPDAANNWGLTPRKVASLAGLARFFRGVPKQKRIPPSVRIQNAEHLADHYWPRFKIPARAERETLKPEQAVDIYVFGPKAKKKQDTVKVRIFRRRGRGANVRYVAKVETPLEKTHLPRDTKIVEFGPENVATVYIPRETKTKNARRSN